MIIDHIGLRISDYEKSKEFYMKCLEPLEITLVIGREIFDICMDVAHGKTTCAEKNKTAVFNRTSQATRSLINPQFMH